jgi:outer membrane protein assembly factor BamD (BamD/ComL family)
VRAHPLASLIWLLVPAILGFFPLHDAFGASLTWSATAEKEELIFKFESRLPDAEPRQRGLTQIQIPIRWSFWQQQRKPKIPDFSSSSIVSSVSITPDGIIIQTRTDDFLFSSSVDSRRKDLIVEFFRPPAQNEPAPQNGTGQEAEPEQTSNASVIPPEAPASNASLETSPRSVEEMTLPEEIQENTTAPATAAPAEAGPPGEPAATQEQPSESVANATTLSGPSSLRGRIERPGHGAQNRTAEPTPDDSRLRRPIDRGAAPPREADIFAGNETAADGQDSNLSDATETTSQTAPANGTTPEGAQEQERNATSEFTPAQAPAGEEWAGNALTDNASGQARIDGTKPDETAGPVNNATVDTASEQVPTNGTAATLALNDTQESPVLHALGNATDDNSTAELEALYATAQSATTLGDWKSAKNAMTAMLAHPKIPDRLREELLYTLANVQMNDGMNDLEGNFTTILEGFEAAKNANPSSPNVPEALSSLGYLHLAVGNVPEAKGHFDLLRRKYPDDPRVAMIDYFWGEHYARRKEYGRAVEHFQYAIQNFPMSKAVQPSTVGLLKAYTELGFFGKALETVNSIERRWPSYYLTDPSFLMAAGYASMLAGNLDRAKDYFWAYVNIVPQANDADVAMARIGDILLKQDKREAAREMYHRTSETYPDREGGLIALMRLAEEGVLDAPSIRDMDPAFKRPEVDPEDIYTRILGHADSPLAPVARLKLAMWRLWNKKFPESLEDVRRFQQDYPAHELLPKTREVADKALRDWVMNDLEKGDFTSAARHWTDHLDLYQGRDPEPQLRLAVATAFMRTGQPREALEMARPFVFGPVPRGELSEPGLDLTLALLVDLQQWRDVVELGKRVAGWGLGPDRQRQVDYALALAHEKLDQPGPARPLWARLATDLNLTDTQRGYAHYFLGRGAMQAGNLERATILGQEALELLKKEKDDLPKIMETLELLVQAAERSGRTQDALAWSLEYDGYVSRDHTEWPRHSYRKAILFKKNGDMKKWRESLNAITELYPASLYGRMAAAELEGVRLEREVEKFR